MRITGGAIRGHKLASPASGDHGIRPTSDRVREALFNILGHQVERSMVLDLFAGTGALGIESLSRGARHAVFVDWSCQALERIRTNLLHCFNKPQASVIRLDLTRSSALLKLRARFPETLRFDLVFLDPPYEKNLAQQALMMVDNAGILASGALVIAEERWGQPLPECTTCLQKNDQRRYGKTGIWIYRHTC